jgi:hypothetical protein
VKASFVPPAPVRELRDLTHTRTVITRERAREVQRLDHRGFHRAVDEGQPGGADTKVTTAGPATTNGPSADEHSSEAASADAA